METVAKFAYGGFGTSGNKPFLAYSRHAACAPQAAMPWSERSHNMRRAFACQRDFPGATLNEFARVLRKAGATEVAGGVVARTLPA